VSHFEGAGLGAAKSCYETAVRYARERVQFGVPIASKQLIQEELVDMASEIVKGEILSLHYAAQRERQGIDAF
jgi:glutaryl-CoA dehydrogenase